MSRPYHLLLWLVLGSLLVAAAYHDYHSPWRRFSQGYTNIDPQADVSRVIQVHTPLGDVDRCPTCHRAMLPHSKAGAVQPFKPHPPIAGHPDLLRFGCTPCHGGQGRRLDRQAHSPPLGGGPDPFLPQPYRQARCARCHVPGRLAQAPALAQGLDEYFQAACTGCHQPGRFEQGLGPDFRQLSTRSAAELEQALLSPREGHPTAVMWSLRWRFDQRTAAGRKALPAVITALLALSSPVEPYRDAWANPTLRVDVPCSSCHRLSEGGKAGRGPAHRCTLLTEEKSLGCPRCHGDPATLPPQEGGECPHIQAARPLCGVCHLRSIDGAQRSASGR